ncbi:MAG: hypothetical protein MZW92_31415 [Comamonadaceae bacterium]|nr:hypothetical protein [Comamonadaceae bacterium]
MEAFNTEVKVIASGDPSPIKAYKIVPIKVTDGSVVGGGEGNFEFPEDWCNSLLELDPGSSSYDTASVEVKVNVTGDLRNLSFWLYPIQEGMDLSIPKDDKYKDLPSLAVALLQRTSLYRGLQARFQTSTPYEASILRVRGRFLRATYLW